MLRLKDQHLEDGNLVEQQSGIFPSVDKNKEAESILLPANRKPGFVFSNWRIGKKIAAGFIVAIGISVIGTVAGIMIGNSYQEKARLLRGDTLEELDLIHHFESSLLRLELSQQRLGTGYSELEPFMAEILAFKTHLEEVEEVWAEVKKSYAEATVDETNEEVAIFEELVSSYEQNVLSHFSATKAQIDQLQPTNFQEEQLPAVSAKFREINNTELNADSDKFLAILDELLEEIDEESEGSEQAIEKADRLRTVTIAIATLSSILVAAILAYLITRAIANPLQKTTAIAEKVTEEEDFSLQAPVITNDEVGQLTDSLNKLIFKVRQLLAERKAAEARLVQTEKMSSLGQLVAGVAHEINNPVNFIHGNLSHVRSYAKDLLHLVDLYQKHYPHPHADIQDAIEAIELEFMKEDFAKILDSMNSGSVRIRDIVKSLRTFSRLDEADVKEVNIHEGIDSTLVILHNRLKPRPEHPGIKVIKEYGRVPKVECFAGQINQVFMNIISNAIDALDEQNKNISYEVAISKPSWIKIKTQVVDDKWAEIRIADNGPGMSQDVADKLFDPFFTTKPVGQGTGLGLAISHQIVTETHNGLLTCISDPGAGTEFVIVIPIRQEITQR
jgi:two-component system NtrC family sensor kinase